MISNLIDINFHIQLHEIKPKFIANSNKISNSTIYLQVNAIYNSSKFYLKHALLHEITKPTW